MAKSRLKEVIGGGVKLAIIRGLPGSGKSTMARNLPGYKNMDHWEADMFFEQNGRYQFDPNKIKEAHQWCQSNVRRSLEAGRSVVVSNTFVRKWEVDPYLTMARELNVPVEILTATGNYRNVHDVPDEVVERMRENWEDF